MFSVLLKDLPYKIKRTEVTAVVIWRYISTNVVALPVICYKKRILAMSRDDHRRRSANLSKQLSVLG